MSVPQTTPSQPATASASTVPQFAQAPALGSTQTNVYDFLRQVTDDPAMYVPQDAPVDGINVTKVMTTICLAALKAIPKVGGLLSALVGAMIPGDKGEAIFTQLRGRIEALVDDKIDETEAKNLWDALQGLRNDTDLYLMTAGKQPKGDFLISLISNVEEKEPAFVDNAAPWYTLQHVVSIGGMHLAALTELVKFYDYFFQTVPPASDWASSRQTSVDNYIKRLRNLLQTYQAKVASGRNECITRHRGQSDPLPAAFEFNATSLNGAPLLPGSNQFFGATIPIATLINKIVQTKTMIDAETYYTSQLDDIIEPSLVWDTFDPSYKPHSYTRFLMNGPDVMGDGSATTMQFFNHRELYETYGPPSRIACFQDADFIRGLQITYGPRGPGAPQKDADVVGRAGISMIPLEFPVGSAVTRLGWLHLEKQDLTRLEFTTRRKCEDAQGNCWFDSGAPGVFNMGPGGPGHQSCNYWHTGYDPALGQNQIWTALSYFVGWATAEGAGAICQMRAVFGAHIEIKTDGTRRSVMDPPNTNP